MADDLSPGETRRWLERLERRLAEDERAMVPATQYAIAHQALTDRVAGAEADIAAGLARVESDMKAGFDRVERTSQERKASLEAKDRELGGQIKALREDGANQRRGRTSTAANWIAASGVIVAIGLLIATLVTSSGR